MKPRKPFAQDSSLLDYEFDSEAEWVEDEPGEELNSEDDMEDEDSIEEDDDGWVVPHGYLSDDEGIEDEKKPIEKQTKQPEKRKTLTPLVPIVLGVFTADVPIPALLSDSKLILFNSRDQIDPFEEMETEETKVVVSKKIPFPPELVTELSAFIQGKALGMTKLVEDFQALYPTLKKATIENKIKEIGIKEKRNQDTVSFLIL